MKMFLIVYCDAADEDVIDTFKKSGIRGYTKMREVRGEGTDTEPKLGTHCWPGKTLLLLLLAVALGCAAPTVPAPCPVTQQAPVVSAVGDTVGTIATGWCVTEWRMP